MDHRALCVQQADGKAIHPRHQFGGDEDGLELVGASFLGDVGMCSS